MITEETIENCGELGLMQSVLLCSGDGLGKL